MGESSRRRLAAIMFADMVGYTALMQEDEADEAVREGRRATELLPVSRDAYDGPAVLTDLARVYAMTGRVEEAVDQLELLVSIPGLLSPPLVAVDPVWDPLRDDPRFRALVEERPATPPQAVP